MEIVTAPDGMPAERVGKWAKEKQEKLRRYVDISKHVRTGFVAPGKAGATFVDLFSACGLSQVRDGGEWIDGSSIAA